MLTPTSLNAFTAVLIDGLSGWGAKPSVPACGKVAHLHAKRVMSNPSTPVSDRLGPFVAGSASSDLIALAQQQDFGLRLVGKEEQTQDHFQQRCDGLSAKTREFFYDFEDSTFLVFQKTVDSAQIPDFIEYLLCWFAQDRLSGVILFGISSEAGTHDQIDQQEKYLSGPVSRGR